MFNIYTNILICLKNQQVEVGKVLTEEALNKELANEYVFIYGDRKVHNPGKILTILIAPNSKYSLVTGNFNKLMQKIPPNSGVKEINIISELEMSSHINKKINIYRKENPGMMLNIHSYKLFIINILKHIFSIPHEICSEEEAEYICARMATSRDKFPKILQSDPQAIWAGARPGMLVKITRHSETSGKSIVYRYCIKG